MKTKKRPTNRGMLSFQNNWEMNQHSVCDTNSNLFGVEDSLDLHHIKGFSTNRLKPEHFKKLIQKVKEKLVMLTIVNGHKNRRSGHICVGCDCLIIGIEKGEK